MAFYKLFYVIHRRTDWHKLWRWERRIMMPEWYAEREEQYNKALARLKMMNTLVYSMCPSAYYSMF